jgi:hypothetical protein
MLNRNDLQRLAQVRLEDAILLLQSNKASSAYYLAGYAIELGLKACISKLFQNDVIPDKGLVNAIYTHRLESLMATSGLLPQLNADIKEDPVFASYWGIVTKWNEASRYEIWDPISAATLIHAIVDEDHGVFPWVKKHW